jgi:hypothetical protein
MSAGEYADLDTLTLDTEGNISKIMSIIYRPITKNKLKSFKYQFKSTIKYWFDDVEDITKYYEIEPYTGKNEAEWDNFPAGIAMGSLGFFLQAGNRSVVNTLISSHPHLPEVRNMMKMILKKKKQKIFITHMCNRY